MFHPIPILSRKRNSLPGSSQNCMRSSKLKFGGRRVRRETPHQDYKTFLATHLHLLGSVKTVSLNPCKWRWPKNFTILVSIKQEQQPAARWQLMVSAANSLLIITTAVGTAANYRLSLWAEWGHTAAIIVSPKLHNTDLGGKEKGRDTLLLHVAHTHTHTGECVVARQCHPSHITS